MQLLTCPDAEDWVPLMAIITHNTQVASKIINWLFHAIIILLGVTKILTSSNIIILFLLIGCQAHRVTLKLSKKNFFYVHWYLLIPTATIKATDLIFFTVWCMSLQYELYLFTKCSALSSFMSKAVKLDRIS